MLPQLIVSGLVLGAAYGLIGLGYSLIYRASGIMNLSQGELLTLGSFIGYTFFAILKLPFAVSLILTILVMFSFGFLLQVTAIRSVLNRSASVTSVMLATFAISYIIQNGVRVIWGSTTLRFPSILSVATVKVAGRTFQTEALMCVAVSLIAMFAIHLFLTKTKFGTAMRAAAMDPSAAKTCGIDVRLTTGITWGISAAVAGLGGMLIGPLYGVFSLLGSSISNKGFSGAVMGGYGDMYGAILGGFILGLMETLVAGLISSDYKDLIAYIVLLVFLFVKPRGLLNAEAISD